jgi:hypothetical protein
MLSEGLSAIANQVALLSVIRTCVFSANLLITLPFVGTYYWRGLVAINAFAAAAYLYYVHAGLVPIFFGRYFFFSGSHFNLGGEIFFSAAFASTLTNTSRLSLMLAALFFAPTFLMEARAAEIGILCSAFVLVWQISSKYGRQLRLAIFFGLGIVAILLIMTTHGSDLANQVLMLNDQTRGEGSDFSGRANHWTVAIEIWNEHPLIGAGSDYPTRLGVLQPHSFFLYALAGYGVLGIAVLLIFFRTFLTVFINGRALHMLAFFPMLAFNDRFVNLNTYPTIMFLYVFSEYARLKFSSRRSELVPVV